MSGKPAWMLENERTEARIAEMQRFNRAQRPRTLFRVLAVGPAPVRGWQIHRYDHRSVLVNQVGQHRFVYQHDCAERDDLISAFFRGVLAAGHR